MLLLDLWESESDSIADAEAPFSPPPPPQFDLLDQESLHESQENTLMIEDKGHPRQYYKFWVVPGRWMRVRYDRLALLALLDR